MNGRDLVFEIGTEELPSSAVYTAIQQLNVSVPKALKDARLEYGSHAVVSSPRRIAVLVSDLTESQPDAVERHKGPAAKIAFDAEGAPTPAAIGFARGKGVPVESLEVVEENGGSYVYATVEVAGSQTVDVLPGLLSQLVAEIEWPKSMRWGSGDTRFSRPVRWLLALFGSDLVPVRFADLEADTITYGHRFLAPGPIRVLAAFEYPTALQGGMVVVDQDARAGLLREGIEREAASLGGTAIVPEKTFAEVVNLVEWPTVATGTFDEGFLDVPKEMLENAMTSHQRYFPVESADGRLMNRFLVAHNGDPERSSHIVSGHERVIRARLSDAAFFVSEDLKTPLEEWGRKLENVVFQEKLGTVADKVRRIEHLAEEVASLLNASAEDRAHAVRAAHLAKADLVTNAVIEFTDLQGVMGRYYALAAGEDPSVASAVEQHYQPRFAGDELPQSVTGRIVSIADKIDTIVGIFLAGMAPRGSADPFALRRSAVGILQIALDGSSVPLDVLVGAALDDYGALVTPETRTSTASAVRSFILARLEGILRDRGFAYDTVDAVLAVSGDDPRDALLRCDALTVAREQSPETFVNLSIAFKRAANLVGEAGGAVDASLLGEHETALYDALQDAEARVSMLMAEGAYNALLETYAALREPIDDFFENVLVMDEDVRLRANRLALLATFVGLFSRFADFGRLAG